MKPRVLLIDTDVEALQTTASLLEREGLDVMRAATFQQIHEAIANREPRVVIIEPVLDGIDGFELCRALRQVYPDYEPAVLMASHRVRGAAPEAKTVDVGARAFLERPDMDDRLLREIRAALESDPLVCEEGLVPIVQTVPVEIVADMAGPPTIAAPRAKRGTALAYAFGLVATGLIGVAVGVFVVGSGWTENPEADRSRIWKGASAITPPRLIETSHVQPRYPPLARQLRRGGTVVLEGIVGEDGRLSEIEVIEDPAPVHDLGRAASAAVRRWRYDPATQGGSPVAMPITIRVDFIP